METTWGEGTARAPRALLSSARQCLGLDKSPAQALPQCMKEKPHQVNETQRLGHRCSTVLRKKQEALHGCSSAQASISEVTGGLAFKSLSSPPGDLPSNYTAQSMCQEEGAGVAWGKGSRWAGSFSESSVFSLACQGKRAAPGCCLLEKEPSTSPASCKDLSLQMDLPPSALLGLAASRPCTLTDSTGRQAGQLLGHSWGETQQMPWVWPQAFAAEALLRRLRTGFPADYPPCICRAL